MSEQVRQKIRPKSAVMTLKIRPISDKNHFFQKMTFFRGQISGVGRNFWQKKMSEISSPKNILLENINFVYLALKDTEIDECAQNLQKIPRLNNWFSKLYTFCFPEKVCFFVQMCTIFWGRGGNPIKLHLCYIFVAQICTNLLKKTFSQIVRSCSILEVFLW